MVDLQRHLGLDDGQWEIVRIFNSDSLGRVAKAIDSKTRFVHYTNADTAMKLLTNKEVWLRKSTNMNDAMEVEHGFNCLAASYRKHKPSFESPFEKLYPGICNKIEKYFEYWLPTYRSGTFIACVSEHDNSENKMGRLSMWRAYGGNAGVAIVMNGDVFHRPVKSDALKAYTSPVAYLDGKGFEGEFLNLINSIKSNSDILSAIGEENFFAAITHAFRYATICTKHPGFLEEREWRVIYSPAIEKSDIIVEAIESISGIPQKVCKLPLADKPELGLYGLELPKLIDRVIIGPCNYPNEICEAFVHLLQNAGVANAESKVVASDIPLRQKV
jgi:hypothetical protein